MKRRSTGRSEFVVLAVSAQLLFLTGCSAEEGSDYPGNMPEGFWVLNQERSERKNPGSHTLWVFEDDGNRLAWVSVEADPQGNIKVTSWDGLYGGEPVEVRGAGMLAQVNSPLKGRIITSGELEGVGRFSEDCSVASDERKMRCTFTLFSESGQQSHVDEFDWVSSGPQVFLESQ